MAVKQLYFKNTVVNNALALQDGGTPPPSGWSGTGWAMGTTPAGQFSRMVVGTESATFETADTLTPPSLSSNSCWRPEQPFNGRFAPGDWTFAFRIRSQKVSGQSGRVNCRIWKSASGVGIPALELTTAVAVGTTVAGLSGSTSQTSTVTLSSVPGLIFNNE